MGHISIVKLNNNGRLIKGTQNNYKLVKIYLEKNGKNAK